MTISKDLLDQLLSGYMDDALSADERTRVEQLLQTNPQVADELQQLRALRESLQMVAQADRDIQLGDGFADRVLEAAVAQARAEGVSDDHPLVRLSEQPSGSARGPRQRFTLRRRLSVVASLAASIVVAVFALRSGGDVQPGPDAIAASNGAGITNGLPQPEEILQAAADAELIPQPETQSLPVATPEMIAAATGHDETTATPTRPGETDSAPPASEAIAKRDPLTSDRNTGSSATAIDSMVSSTPNGGAASLQAILVWDVRLTDQGRAAGVVRNAMREAQIELTGQQQITPQIVNLAAETTQPDSDEKISILYLQAPAKSLDRFYLNLVADQSSVEAIRISIAMGAPILAVVNDVRQDPTAVQHENAAMELAGDDSAIAQLASQLDQLTYAPMSREAVAATSQGPDVMAQVLVVVR